MYNNTILKSLFLLLLLAVSFGSAFSQLPIAHKNVDASESDPKFEIYWKTGGTWKSGGGWGTITIRDNLMTLLGNLSDPVYTGPADVADPCFMIQDGAGEEEEFCISMSGCPFFVVSGDNSLRQVYVPTSCMPAPGNLKGN